MTRCKSMQMDHGWMAAALDDDEEFRGVRLTDRARR
jgi:hypothetical protein